MSPSRSVFLPAIICIAGLSFAAGRVVTSLRQAPVVEVPLGAVLDVSTLEPLAPISVPAHVPDMVALPFAEIYRILKSAPPETIRSYCNELEQLPIGPSRNVALSAFFKTLVQVNPGMAKELILQLKKDERWLPLSAIREAAMPRGMETVAEVLLSFDRIEISSCSYDLLRETLDEWGKSDPMALKLFLESHRGQDVECYFDKLVRNWAAYDPEAAREWMANELEKRPLIPTRPTEDGGEEIFDGDWRSAVEEMSVAWVEGFLAYDPDAAVNYVLEHASNPEVERALFTFSRDLFTMSPARAHDFILHLPEEEGAKALEGIANKANPLVRSDANDNTTSPRYVAEWMLQFPPQAWQERIGWVLRGWESSNPQELFAWIAELPTQMREATVHAFPSYSSAENAQENFDTIMQAGDPVLRAQLLERLMREAKDARTAMRAVLEKSELRPEEKLHLASLIPASNEDRAEASTN